MTNRDFKSAIETVNQIKHTETRHRLMAKYASEFLSNEPQLAIRSMCQPAYYGLPAESLVPALLSIKDRAKADLYVAHEMSHSNSRMLANLHVFFLAAENDVHEFTAFLDQQESLKKANLPVGIDTEFALGVARRFGFREAEAKIYCLLGRYEEAVRFALRNRNVKMAKRYANMSSGDERRKRGLWIMIAGSVIEEEMGMKRVFKLIDKSKVLTLGDVMQFLSPKLRVESFKDGVICELKKYSSRIDALKSEIENCKGLAEETEAQLKDSRGLALHVPVDQYCDHCGQRLLGSGKSYVFPCLHAFHSVSLN